MNTRPYHEETGIRGRSAFRLAVTDESGTGRFEDVYLHEGCAPPGVPDDRRAILIVGDCVGDVTIRRCWLEQWAENTIYAENVPGHLLVEDCFFRNTNVGSPRVGGGTTVRNCTVIKDGLVPLQGWWNREYGGGAGARGVWIGGGADPHGSEGAVVIEDCDFQFTHAKGMRPPITLAPPSEETVIRNTRVLLGAGNWPALRFADNGETALSIEGLHITDQTDRGEPPIDISGTVTEWGEISGTVKSPHGIATDDRVTEAMDAGEADLPDTSAPLPPPPKAGNVPPRRN